MRSYSKTISILPYLIAITGSFGTGKSTVGRILKQLGICVVDTDHIVGKILATKNHITKKIIKMFGYADKKSLAKVVFHNPSKRKKLESIVHPEVRRVLKIFISKNRNKKIIAVLIPLLFESKMNKTYDEVWCVTCSKKEQIKRLIQKGFKLSEIKKRILAQLPQKEKVKRSDFVIDNSGTIQRTKRQVARRVRLLVR